MRHLLIFPLLSAAALAACTPPEESSTAPVLDLPQSCGADELQGLVGQPQSAVSSREFAPGTRIIGPEDPVTADYRGDRLNIEIGPDGNVAKVACF
ncbi:I78 family peptidase inhibitor [Paracoccus onubensis]|uniref:Peptidase inhibitor I78 family protein n=1 Tax=Paracoccus onubensis TaxID=1675788 RepID=A0A418SPI3_9RHOB|nr:I78 family peptidase inhibitor [Paracoccus onubensis]RJE82876.1 hypothetical protein D3P04_17680 [Paracoccus onubensis]